MNFSKNTIRAAVLGVVAVVVAVLMTAFSPAQSGEAALKPQATCPIMGGTINKKLFVDVLGKRIYVCCPGCIGAIKADPQAALKKIAENGEVAEDAPKAK